MLQDVEHARVVKGQRLEGDAEGHVLLGPVEPDRLEAGAVVPQLVERRAELGDAPRSNHGEAVQSVAG